MTFRVLLSAYACSPELGSEAGVGWNWAMQLAAAGANVWVLTQAANKDAIEATLKENQPNNLHFVYVKDRSQRLPWRRYLMPIWAGSALDWQETAYEVAKDLQLQIKFDVAHHVSYGSLQTGSHLWRLACPFIFGPVGGGQIAPKGFRRHLRGGWILECIRTIVSGHLYPYILNARATVNGAKLVIVANRDTEVAARKLGASEVKLMTTVGVTAGQISGPSSRLRFHREPLKILWVARLLPRKGLLLALEAMSLVRTDTPWKLTILGDGRQGSMLPRWIEELNLGDKVEWRGMIPWVDVQASYDDADLFLFTSLRDTDGGQLLEAMSRGVPILTLDHHGAATLVPDSAGIKVPVSTARGTAESLARAVERLAANRDLLRKMSDAAIEVAWKHTWDRKATKALKIYGEVIDKDRAAAGLPPKHWVDLIPAKSRE